VHIVGAHYSLRKSSKEASMSSSTQTYLYEDVKNLLISHARSLWFTATFWR
jgi:hypothetical protein